MHEAGLVLALLIAVAALVTIARRIRVAYPILLVVGGLVLGLVPGVPAVPIDPDLVFLLILPPLLYIAAYFTPGRSLRNNLGTIAFLAVGLVLVSALAVAVVARWLIPGLGWPLAIALGAIVSPPDAISATAIATRLSVPRRIVTILEGESLLNDATALTIYGIALASAFGGVFSASQAVLKFTVALVVGGVIGLAVGAAVAQIRKRIEDTPVEMTISVLTPYAAFLPAQRLGLSGVIATVAAGLYLGHRGSEIMGADARLTGRAFWETLTFLINGFVFIVMGLQVPVLLGAFAPSVAWRLVAIGLAVSLVLVAVRTLVVFGTVFLPARLRGRQDSPWLLGCSLVLSWAGMRGVVSLAAALALPTTIPAGPGPFPVRAAMLIVTLTVIVFTLLGQGLTLPWLIRRLGLGTDVEVRAEEATARRHVLEAATRRIEELYPVWPGHRPLLDRLRDTYRDRSEHIERQQDPAVGEEEDRELIEHREIRRRVIDAEREAILRLRAEGAIDDNVLRDLEREVDLEERRMDA